MTCNHVFDSQLSCSLTNRLVFFVAREVISSVPFCPDLTPIGQLVFLSVSVLFQTILSNARLDSSKLDEKGHKVVKSPTRIAGRNQLN